MTDQEMALTVIIPVRNESNHILQTLTQLRDQSLAKILYEIIVCDGVSDDNTVEIVSTFIKDNPDLNLRCLTNVKRLSSSARNIAVKNGRGEYFLLIDGHVYIDNRKLLETCIDLARLNNALCLGRPQPLNPPDIIPFQQAVNVARNSFLAHSPESYIYSGITGWTSPFSIGVMYHKSIFEKIGLFDESFDAAEDVEFNYRVEKQGIQCYTSPDMKVYYYPRDNLKTLFFQLLRYGKGRARLFFRYPERMHISTLAPPLFVISIIIPAVSSIFFGTVMFQLLFVYLFLYSVILLVESARLNFMFKTDYLFTVPIIMAVIHTGLGLGLIKGCIDNLITIFLKKDTCII